MEQLAVGKRNAVVITSDHTRPVPSRIILPQILERLRKGNPDIQITILVATGLHRPTNTRELAEKFGEKIFSEERIVLHDAKDAEQLRFAGTLPSGGVLSVNRLVSEADLVVAEGFIEPHFFAGFSGGRKAILPGVASAEAIMVNHCAEFIAHPNARTGNLAGNPIHKDMLAAARMAKLAFIVNVILDEKKQIVHAVAGDADVAHRKGCGELMEHCGVTVPPADIVVTSNGGYPLDQNFYQSVKGLTAGEAACREGGVIIMVSACNDGTGGDFFYKMLANASTPQELLAQILRVPRTQTQYDQWQVQIMARVLCKCRVILVTRDFDHALARQMHVTPVSTLAEAMELADKWLGKNAKIAVIPDGVSIVCNPTGESKG